MVGVEDCPAPVPLPDAPRRGPDHPSLDARAHAPAARVIRLAHGQVCRLGHEDQPRIGFGALASAN
jgi:hypothetical protein